MKKNIFKFTYIALTVVAMFALGRGTAHADCVAQCAYGCDVNDTDCLNGGGDVDACQGAHADCKDSCPGACGVHLYE
jgi:hypothetical protein